MKTVLGLDLGTQSLKAVFYDYEKKDFAAIVSSPLEVERDNQGKAEQLAGWWLEALANCMQQVSDGIKKSVQAIAVSGQQHGFVPLDDKGEVLAPVKLWCDTATHREVEEITGNIGGKHQAIALAGNPVLAGYTSPKIRWLKNNLTGTYNRLNHILLPHDYLNYILTSEYAMEYGDASGTGLLNVRTREWSARMLDAVDDERDLGECLPELFDADQFIGTTTGDIEKTYGLPAGIPVATGGGDNMMGAIGTGNIKPGELTISLGSSGTLYAHSDMPVIDPEGNIAAFCSSTGGWLPLLCTMNCTLATELVRGPLNISIDEFDVVAGKAAPGCDGLITLPFFNGERTPNLPHARACLFGLTSHNCSREHMLRSTIEGTSFSLKFGLDELKRLGLQAKEIILTGGGSQSTVWRQAIADIFQLPVVMLKGEEGASFGAALQALWVLQKQQDRNISIADICREHVERDHDKCIEPDNKNIKAYESGYTKYREVLDTVKPLLGPGL